MPNTVAANVKNWEISSSVPPAGTCSALSHIPAAPNAAADIREKTAQQYCIFSLGFMLEFFNFRACEVLRNCVCCCYQWLAVRVRISILMNSCTEIGFSNDAFVDYQVIGIIP